MNPMEYTDAAVARTLAGVRLILTVGFPGPWGQSIKKMFEYKGISYLPVAQYAGQPNEALQAWVGVRNAPVIVKDNERPLTTWSEAIMFAERQAPTPALLPSDSESRALVFGLINEIAGDRGFGWCRRLMLFDDALAADPKLRESTTMEQMMADYEVNDETMGSAPDRIVDILGMLACRLKAQRALGSATFVGRDVTATDIYWACFSTMLEPLPESLCRMPAEMRRSRTPVHPAILAAKDPILLEHRNWMFERWLGPLEF
jgi:glutathione S-transferase